MDVLLFDAGEAPQALQEGIMIRGTMGKIGVLKFKGQVIGLSFGADASTEHEVGIRPIRTAFGIDLKELGIEGHRVHEVPPMTVEDDGTEVTLLYGARRGPHVDNALQYPRSWQKDGTRSKDDLVCAWDESSFGIRARGAHRESVLELKAALEAKDAALLLTSQFLCSGFNLLIVSRFPVAWNKKWVQEQKTARQLLAQWDDSGVEQLLRDAGKRWFSLGHRVIKDDKGVLRTWLNPMDQSTYSAGWFSFDELRQWADDKGPVILQDLR